MIEFLLAVPYMVSHLHVSCLLPLWEMEYRYVVSFFVDEDEGGERMWIKEVCSRIRRKRMSSKKRRDGDLYIPYLTLP